MTDDPPEDKSYAAAVIARMKREPSLTEEQRVLLDAAVDEEERIAYLEAVLRREGKL